MISNVDLLDLQEGVEAGDFQHLADFVRGIEQVDLDTQAAQRRKHAQHAAGHEFDRRQIERQHLALVLRDQLGNLQRLEQDSSPPRRCHDR